MALILDSSVLYAALDRTDRAYARCRSLMDDAGELRVIPSPVLPEVDWLLSHRGAPAVMLALIRDIEREVFVVEDLEHEDYARARELMDKYLDQELGFVDASILAITERFGERKLATLDKRHFSILRPRHTDALELVPG